MRRTASRRNAVLPWSRYGLAQQWRHAGDEGEIEMHRRLRGESFVSRSEIANVVLLQVVLADEFGWVKIRKLKSWRRAGAH